MKKLLTIIFGVVPLVFVLGGLLWVMRPWSQFGIGAHEESFDKYTVSVPYGWTAVPLNEEKSKEHPNEMHRGLVAAGSIWFSSCIIRLDTPEEYQADQSVQKFPTIELMAKVPNAPTPIISPTTKLTIDGTPFEKAEWTIKVGNRDMKGVEYRSVPNGHDDVIIIGANVGFGQPGELAQAEYMIMSLKHKKQ